MRHTLCAMLCCALCCCVCCVLLCDVLMCLSQAEMVARVVDRLSSQWGVEVHNPLCLRVLTFYSAQVESAMRTTNHQPP